MCLWLVAEMQMVGAGGRFACGCGWWQKGIWLGMVAELQLVGAGGRTIAVWDG
jgi:hypothetical protein